MELYVLYVLLGMSITLNVILYRRYRGALWFVFFLWHHLETIKNQGWRVGDADKKTIEVLLGESREVAGRMVDRLGW